MTNRAEAVADKVQASKDKELQDKAARALRISASAVEEHEKKHDLKGNYGLNRDILVGMIAQKIYDELG